MFEHFTDRARKTMSNARAACVKYKHEFIGTEHILLGMIDEGGGVGCKVLKALGVRLQSIVDEVIKITQVDHTPQETSGQVPFSPRAKRVIELSGESACQLGQNKVGTEHVLLGLVKENEGIAAQVLNNFGVTTQKVVEKLAEMEVIPSSSVPRVQKKYLVTVQFRGKQTVYEVEGISTEDAAMRTALRYAPEFTDCHWVLIGIKEAVAEEAISGE